MKKTCPCCGYKTLDKNQLFGMCEICNWEDDPIQSTDPDYNDGANPSLNLRQAQKNFLEFGACEESAIEHVRTPSESDIKDDNFKVLQ